MKASPLLKRIAQFRRGRTSSPETDNDVSYEDALLDWKLRRFMQAEYGHAEPPKGMFARVLAAIKSGRPSSSATRSYASVLRRLAVGFYNSLAKPTATSRLLPGVVAFALVVLVLSTNSKNIIINNLIPYNIPSSPQQSTVSTTSDQIIVTEQEHQQNREQAIRRGNVPEGLSQFYPPANIGFYHPVERHLPLQKKRTSEADSQSSNTEYLITSKSEGF